jgi:hypothetical protein
MDPGWLKEFRRLLRKFVAVSDDVSQYHHLPGYPLWIGFANVRDAFSWLRHHIFRVVADAHEHREQDGISTGGYREEIWISYHWICGFIEGTGIQTLTLNNLTTDTIRDVQSWLPTEAELEACQAILSYLSHLVFEAPRDDSEIPTVGSNTPGPNTGPDRLSIDKNQVNLNELTYVLEENESAFLRELVNAGPGHWVSGSEMGPMVQPRPDRVYGGLKKRYAWIKTVSESSHRGYRLKSDVITSTHASFRP